MRIRLKGGIDVNDPYNVIWAALPELDKHLGPHNPNHERQGMAYFFTAEKWHIDMAIDEDFYYRWDLVLDKRHTTKPWFTSFLLRFT